MFQGGHTGYTRPAVAGEKGAEPYPRVFDAAGKIWPSR
jgi:hypothetical protein